MKIRFLLICIIILISNSLSAKEFKYFLSTYFGFERSSYEEVYYFEDYSKYKDEKASLLEWNENLSYSLGINASFQYKNLGFFTDLSTKLPLKCGKMKDSDYLENGLKFNYSISENYLNNAFDATTGFYYIFDLSFLKIKPAIIASYSYISFSAKNGIGWYGSAAHTSDGKTHSWDSEYAHYYPDGKYHIAGVDYLNHTFCFMTGLEFAQTFFNFWETGVGFYFAPFTYSYAKDHHLGKSKNFYTEDFIYNYFMNYKMIINNNFIISEKMKITTSLEGDLQLLEKGEDYMNGEPNQQKGGESYKAFKVKAGFCFML